jgi:hypothetical protein
MPTPCHCCSYCSPLPESLIVICHRRVFEEIVQAWTWLHSTPAMGADGITASRQRETGTAALSADMGRRMNPTMAVRANVHHHVLIGLARKVSESDRAVLLEEDVRWGARLSHVVRFAGLAMEAKIPEARAVRTACGGIVESPESGSSSVPTPSERESHKDFAVLPCRDNIPTFLPHRSITISDESRSTGRRCGSQ